MKPDPRRLSVYLPPLRNRRFWAVQGLILLIAGLHTALESIDFFENTDNGSHYSFAFVPVALFFVPVVYAAVNFGRAGSVATSLWCTVLTVPNLLMFHVGLDQPAELLQIAIINAIAVFIGHRVDQELSARRHAEAATTALRTYAAHVVGIQEEERKRVAQELHDETVQRLIIVCRELDLVEELAGSLGQAASEELREARRSVEEVVKGLRDFARVLRPPILDDLGLTASVRGLLTDIAERRRVRGQFEVVGEERRLSADVELALFRIAQEALHNVARHARAANVTVTLRFASGEAELIVTDDGVGFDLPGGQEFPDEGHLGLLGMRERAEALGGRLAIQSSSGRGTELSVLVPDECAANGAPRQAVALAGDSRSSG